MQKRQQQTRQHTQALLKKSESRFSSAFHQNPFVMTLTSLKDDRYLDVNAEFEQITGWKKKEVVGRTPYAIGIWDDPKERVEIHKRLLAGKEVRNFLAHLRLKNREHRLALISAELIRHKIRKRLVI